MRPHRFVRSLIGFIAIVSLIIIAPSFATGQIVLLGPNDFGWNTAFNFHGLHEFAVSGSSSNVIVTPSATADW